VRTTHARLPPRRGGAKASTWWGRAWVRAVEEASYGEAELRTGRALARGGDVGRISVDVGGFLASVVVADAHGDTAWTVSGTVPVLDEPSAAALVETVAAEAGRIGALLAGELPHTLVEHAEEMGVELLPYGSELGTTCTCETWADPCPHAVAVLLQLGWLIDADPLVLLHLRGLPREELLGRLRTGAVTHDPDDPEDPGGGSGSGAADLDLDVGYDAAIRAARLLELLDDPRSDPRSVEHLL
jgi:uncharacterized Zn finger protein